MPKTVERKWMPMTTCAKDYLGVSPDLLRSAIVAGELPAIEKPKTRRRKPDAIRENHHWWVNTDDVDAWMRSHPLVFP